jgi:hypothetical protein
VIGEDHYFKNKCFNMWSVGKKNDGRRNVSFDVIIWEEKEERKCTMRKSKS